MAMRERVNPKSCRLLMQCSRLNLDVCREKERIEREEADVPQRERETLTRLADEKCGEK